MANDACEAFDRLALQASQLQHQAAATSQQHQPPHPMTRLDDELHAASSESPGELRRWWEEQLAGGRAPTLQGEIDKWKQHSQKLLVRGPAHERLRKLLAVEAAVKRGDIPSEVVTAQGYFAFKRQLQAAQQQQQATQQQRVLPAATQRAWPAQAPNSPWLDVVRKLVSMRTCMYLSLRAFILQTKGTHAALLCCACRRSGTSTRPVSGQAAKPPGL